MACEGCGRPVIYRHEPSGPPRAITCGAACRGTVRAAASRRKPAERRCQMYDRLFPLEQLDANRSSSRTARFCPCCAGQMHRIGECIHEALRCDPRPVCEVLRTGTAEIRLPRLRERGGIGTCAVAVDHRGHGVDRAGRLGGGLEIRLAHAAQPADTNAGWLRGHARPLTTLVHWVDRAAWWLEGLYDLQLHASFMASRASSATKRHCRCSRRGGAAPASASFWAHAVDDRPWQGPAPPAVVYVFATGRDTEGDHRATRRLLRRGVMQVDGYGAYKALDPAHQARPDPAGVLSRACTP